jgi:hypothetical protein
MQSIEYILHAAIFVNLGTSAFDGGGDGVAL